MTNTTTTKGTKITKKEMFTALLQVAQNTPTLKSELAKQNHAYADKIEEFLSHEIYLLTSKTATKSSKPSKTQVENEGFKAKIVDVLTGATAPVSISEIQEQDSDLATLSNQRVSALLTQLCNAGQVKRIKDKKKTYFTLA